jgi:hypothetical protein
MNSGGEQTPDDPGRPGGESRLRRLREDARRPLAVNLAEGLALSEFLSTFTGAAWETVKSEKSQKEDQERK